MGRVAGQSWTRSQSLVVQTALRHAKGAMEFLRGRQYQDVIWLSRCYCGCRTDPWDVGPVRCGGMGGEIKGLGACAALRKVGGGGCTGGAEALFSDRLKTVIACRPGNLLFPTLTVGWVPASFPGNSEWRRGRGPRHGKFRPVHVRLRRNASVLGQEAAGGMEGSGTWREITPEDAVGAPVWACL